MSEQQASTQEFTIQRIYTKDLSLESPATPYIFRDDWQPAVNMELGCQNELLNEGIYHVVLSVTVTVKKDDKVVFLLEVKKAGVFSLKGFTDEQREHMLGSYCPSILFPYARELVSELAIRAGFPPLYLSPINFDAFYAEHKRKQAEVAPVAAE